MFATPERRLVFDINDFDETLPGPWEWDVKRLVASLAVAGRDNGYSRKERRRICVAGAATYRKAMRGFADSGNLDVLYASIDVETWMQEWGGEPDHEAAPEDRGGASRRPAPATPCRRWAS